jgi:hypothetical protein
MKNNTLGLNSNVISAILTIADNLRANYRTVGATNCQLPRNPFPLQKLVVNVLPTRKAQGMTVTQIETAIQESGYTTYTRHTLTQTVKQLRNSGAIKFTGTGHSKRYWFSL